jgi:hypothetical protein
MNLNEAETPAQKSVTPSAYAMINANADEVTKAKQQNVKSPDRKWFLHRVVQQMIPSLSAQVIMAKQQEAEMQQQELQAAQAQQAEEQPQEQNPEQTA